MGHGGSLIRVGGAQGDGECTSLDAPLPSILASFMNAEAAFLWPDSFKKLNTLSRSPVGTDILFVGSRTVSIFLANVVENVGGSERKRDPFLTLRPHEPKPKPGRNHIISM